MDKRTDSEPLDLDGDGNDDEVVSQQAAGARPIRGSGEFPDPDAPPSDAAAGSDPETRERIVDAREGGDPRGPSKKLVGPGITDSSSEDE